MARIALMRTCAAMITITPIAASGIPAAGVPEIAMNPPTTANRIPGSTATSAISPPIRTLPAICMPQVLRISATDSLIACSGPLPRRMISGRTKNVMMDHATASSDASTRRRIATIALLLLASPRTADSSQPTAVWIPAQPISAPSRGERCAQPGAEPAVASLQFLIGALDEPAHEDLGDQRGEVSGDDQDQDADDDDTGRDFITGGLLFHGRDTHDRQPDTGDDQERQDCQDPADDGEQQHVGVLLDNAPRLLGHRATLRPRSSHVSSPVVRSSSRYRSQ